MIEEDYKFGWKQHFPTYHFEKRDIALEEYKVAAKSLEAEERVFLNASNVTLVSSAALGSLLVGSSENLTTAFEGVVPSIYISIALLTLALAFSFISLRYFSDRQRAILFAARKVIVLRRMLGLNYGEIQLILPNWRVEGADQPFALRLFPGWLTYVAYPFWIIAIITCSVVFFLSAFVVKNYNFPLSENEGGLLLVFIAGTWFTLIAFAYRVSLFDANERFRLLVYKFLSKLIFLPLAENFEYIIYRAKLAAYENSRIHISGTSLKKFLIFIEDKNFHNHKGISYKALIRAALSQFGVGRRSGGSTIHQQLIRTLFIRDLKKPLRRKIVELGLCRWIEDIFSKQDILDIYLASVRFERGVFGIAASMKHFWGEIVKEPSNAQAFFLIERVSNIHSGLLSDKVIQTAKNAQKNGLLASSDLQELIGIYNRAAKDQKIKASAEQLSKFASALGT